MIGVGLVILSLSLFSSQAQAGWVKDDYLAFRDADCEPAEQGVYSPVVLRVLRSTPWAMVGHDFEDEDLHALFGADGDWYRPQPGRLVRLPAEDVECVARIEAWEAHLRQMHCIENDSQAALTARIDVYRWHRQDMALGEMHRYIEGMVPDERQMRSACRVSRMTRELEGGRWVDWEIEFETIRRPTVAMLEAEYRRLFPDDEGGEPSADYVDKMERWERRMTPISQMRWDAEQIEGDPGDELFRRADHGVCWGTGLFMDQTWFCLEAGEF